MIETKREVSFWPLFIFSLPSIFSSLLEPIASFIDSALLGNLKTQWLAAIAVASILFNSFTWIFNFIIHVSTQRMAKELGGGDEKKALGSLKVSLLYSLGLGILTIFLMIIAKDGLYVLAGSRSDFHDDLDDYFMLRIWGQPFVLMAQALLGGLRSYKMIKSSFWVLLFSTLINAALSYFFLYQLSTGISGAAWGTVIAHGFIVISCLLLLFKDQKRRVNFLSIELKALDWKGFQLSSFQFFGRSLTLTTVFFVTNKIASLQGTLTLAAHQIILQVWLFSSFFIDGLAITANVLGARFLGAKDYHNIKELLKNLTIMGALFGIVFSLCFFFKSREMISLFTKDLKLVGLTQSFWTWVWGSQLINCLCFLIDGFLFSSGDYKFLRNMMISGALFIFLPFALGSYWYNQYPYLLAGLVLLNLWRAISGYFKFFRIIRPLES